MSNVVGTSFRAVFGIVAGYGHDNATAAADPAAVVAAAWQAALEEEFSASGILVGAVVTAGRVVYPAKFGCPREGEIVAVVSGDSNPAFVRGPEAIAAFKAAVARVVRATKIALQQERVQLTFTDLHGFVYDEPDGQKEW